MRIIYVLHHSISPFLGNIRGEDARYYNSGFPMRQAKQMAVRHPEYELECWRPESSLSREFVWEDEYGIVHRVFPSRYLRFNLEFSPSLLKALRAVKRNGNVIIDIKGIYNTVTYMILLNTSEVPIIGQSGGGWPALALYRASQRQWLRHLYLLQHLVERAVFPRFSHIFAISTYEKGLIESLLKVTRVSFRPAGVDFTHFCPGDKSKARQDCGLPQHDRIILFVGRLEPSKGAQYLIQAFPKILQHYPDSQLVLIGSGTYLSELQRSVERLKLNTHVTFIGYVPNQDLPDWYRAADVFVLPTLYEGFGVVCVEAMACGTPLVGTDTGGVPDIVRGFECGLLVPPKDPEALANAVCQVLAEPDMFCPNIERARRLFDWDVVVDERVKLYRNLLKV